MTRYLILALIPMAAGLSVHRVTAEPAAEPKPSPQALQRFLDRHYGDPRPGESLKARKIERAATTIDRAGPQRTAAMVERLLD